MNEVQSLSILDIARNVSTIITSITALIAFIGLICKPLRTRAAAFIRKITNAEERDRRMQELVHTQTAIVGQLQGIETSIARLNKNDIAALGNSIKLIYQKYKDVKRIPYWEQQSAIQMFEAYDGSGGNHGVGKMFEEIMTWEVIM